MVYILYHGGCYDGYGSAFSAWKKYGENATYIPCYYGKPLPGDIPDGSEVYMIDFSGPREKMLEWNGKYRFTVLDHHKTAEENLKGLSFAHFDMNKSGALLAWEYFHPDIPVPLLISHISDRDLWTKAMSGTDEVHAALLSYPMDFNVWDSFNVEDLKREGVALLRMSNQTVENICKNAFYTEFDQYSIIAVNTSSHWSEVGAYLLEKYPKAIFAVSFTCKEDIITYSLRSRENFDVSAIAKIYGGGGHKQAAGFELRKKWDKRYLINR